MDGFVCQRCGHCCTDLDTATLPCREEDYRRWSREGRTDILDWVGIIAPGGTIVMLEMWVHPRTGRTPRQCPWIRREADGEYTCDIHDTKPWVCANYPFTPEHAWKTGCPGLGKVP